MDVLIGAELGRLAMRTVSTRDGETVVQHSPTTDKTSLDDRRKCFICGNTQTIKKIYTKIFLALDKIIQR